MKRAIGLLCVLAILTGGGAAAPAAEWTCYATGENFCTTTTTYNIKSQYEVLSYGGATSATTRRAEGAIKFDVSAIPPRTVLTVVFHFYVNAAYYPYWSVTPVTSNPVATIAGPLWTDIDAEATSGYYKYLNESSSYAPGWKSFALEGTAEADLTAIVNGPQEWFAIGVVERDSSAPYYLEIDGYGDPNPPYIVVDDEYAVPGCYDAPEIPGSAGLSSYTGDTSGEPNFYDCNAACVGYLPHPGPDTEYRLTLPGGCQICATLNQSEMTWNGGLYLVTDWLDVDGSCVAGASGWLAGGPDETFCYEPAATEDYCLIVDGRSAGDHGAFRLDVWINCIAGPTGLSCMATASDLDLAWSNHDTYSSIEVWGDGALVATLPGTATTYGWVPADQGVHCAYVEAYKADGSHEASNSCCAVWGFGDVTVYDFNANEGGFVVQGTGGWEWGALTYGPCVSGADGNLWATRLAGMYDNDACWLLDSPDIELTDEGGVICFDHGYDIEGAYDGGNVWFTTDDYWYYLLDPATRPYPGLSNGAITNCSWVDGRPIFTGDSGGWVTDCWELTGPMWADQTIHLRFAFGSDSSVVHPGWAIDNVTIYTSYPLPPSCSYTIHPLSGTVPFVTNHRVTLTNHYWAQYRRLAGRIDVRLANGNSYSNWRSGYTNIAPGASFVKQWNQNIPALAAVIGDNRFSLLAVDVTPPPYNQPPYPPSGDTCNVTNTVTAGAP